MENEAILVCKDIVKKFGPVNALNGVDFEVRRGEIRGLIGENGSGKSTLTSIMAGMQKATSGTMEYKGKPWDPSTMAQAQEQGVCMILQESNTVRGCTVAENIFAGQLHKFSKFGIVNMKKMTREAQRLLDSFGVGRIRAADNIDKYSFEDRKMIEIVRSVSSNTEILVVDETTTALSFDARELFYGLMKKLAEQNKAVIFISHDMDEILQQCTHLTVLRDGDIIGHLTGEEMRQPGASEKIRYMMVGREIGDAYYRSDYDTSHGEEVALEFQDVTMGEIKHFSLQLHRGEIVGFGGLSGCGMRLIGRAGFGLEKLTTGSVMKNGVKIKDPLTAIRNGIGYISKDRDTEALILSASIADNIVFPSLDTLSNKSFIDPRKEKKLVKKEVDRYLIKCNSPKQLVSTLSGGNKQKVSFAKWTAKDSDVIIMDCPTRGVDIGVKQAMYAFIAQMKRDGKAILLISEELSELIGMADKIIILKDFAVSGEFMRSPDLKETDIIGSMI